MTPFYNLSSLVLGLSAWFLAFAGIFLRNRKGAVMLASFTCCGAALALQFFELRHRILIGDFAAIADIYPTMAWVALILLLGTVFLNLIALSRKPK